MLSRRRFLKWLTGLSLGGLALGSYAFAIEPGFRLRVQHWAVQPKQWPRGFNLRIAALADIHAAEPHMSLKRIERIVAKTNALKPDLVVLLGDYAAGHRFVSKPVPIQDHVTVLAQLKAPLGVYAVLGNHDWWDDLEAQKRGQGPTVSHHAFASVGLPVLENDAIKLYHQGKAFWLAGLGDQIAFHGRLQHQFGWPRQAFTPSINPYSGVDDQAAMLAKITDTAPVILLAHEPDIFPVVSKRIALTFSGHTHGGQLRLFGYAPMVPSRFGNRYAYGVVEENNKMLIVSGGLGCSIAPIRFGMPPEITLVELG